MADTGTTITEVVAVELVHAASLPGPLDAHYLALAFLDDVAASLDSIPDYDPTLEGAPERQFVSPGISVDDFVGRDCCSQIAVWITPLTEAGTSPGGLDDGKRASRFAWINQVSLTARVTRCFPTSSVSTAGIYTPPTADELTEAAKQHDADAWALWNYLHSAVHKEHLLEHCDEVFFDNITAIVPSGGCGGWVVSVRAALGGYEATIV